MPPEIQRELEEGRVLRRAVGLLDEQQIFAPVTGKYHALIDKISAGYGNVPSADMQAFAAKQKSVPLKQVGAEWWGKTIAGMNVPEMQKELLRDEVKALYREDEETTRQLQEAAANPVTYEQLKEQKANEYA